MDFLLRVTPHWLQPDQLSATERVESLTMDRSVRALPQVERKSLGLKVIQVPRDPTWKELFSVLFYL